MQIFKSLQEFKIREVSCAIFANGLIILMTGLLYVIEGQVDSRVRPPASVSCDRNNLTAYSGKVVTYSRRANSIKITILTDWDTTETVSLSYLQKSGPWRWFLLRGNEFDQPDWKKIESAKGKLHPDMRTTVWVCTDGRKPIIDWQPR